MPSKRKFHRTVIQVEILSEEPWEEPWGGPNEVSFLQAVEYDINEGHCSGDITVTTLNEVVDGPTMAKLLVAQRSAPEFLGLTPEGEDNEDANYEECLQCTCEMNDCECGGNCGHK